MKPLAVLLLAFGGCLLPGTAFAHEGGKAEPRIAAHAEGSGYNRMLVVRLTDLDSKSPVSGATVTARAQMTEPHLMTLVRRTIPEVTPRGTYRLPYTFAMPGDWKLELEVTGPRVVRARATLAVPIQATGPAPHTTTLATRLDTKVTERDWLSMLMLWLHSLAAVGWIVGVVVMGIALATPGFLATGVRGRIATAYRSWGAWVHWAAVPVIVGTGIYNMVYVSPFKLRWPWDHELEVIPYGETYEAILIVKLALFIVLLASGTAMLMRVLRRADGPDLPSGPLRLLLSGLGAPGAVYLLTIPAILAAAMALRYVHILSHVAEVVNS